MSGAHHISGFWKNHILELYSRKGTHDTRECQRKQSIRSSQRRNNPTPCAFAVFPMTKLCIIFAQCQNLYALYAFLLRDSVEVDNSLAFNKSIYSGIASGIGDISKRISGLDSSLGFRNLSQKKSQLLCQILLIKLVKLAIDLRNRFSRY